MLAQDTIKKDDKMKMEAGDTMPSSDKLKSGDMRMKGDKKPDRQTGDTKKDDKMMPGDRPMEKKQ